MGFLTPSKVVGIGYTLPDGASMQQEVPLKDWPSWVATISGLGSLPKATLATLSIVISTPEPELKNIERFRAQSKEEAGDIVHWVEKQEYDVPDAGQRANEVQRYQDRIARIESLVKKAVWSTCTLNEQETPCSEAIQKVIQESPSGKYDLFALTRKFHVNPEKLGEMREFQGSASVEKGLPNQQGEKTTFTIRGVASAQNLHSFFYEGAT